MIPRCPEVQLGGRLPDELPFPYKGVPGVLDPAMRPLPEQEPRVNLTGIETDPALEGDRHNVRAGRGRVV